VGQVAKRRFVVGIVTIASLSVIAFIFMTSAIQREARAMAQLEQDTFQYILGYKVSVVSYRLVLVDDAQERDSLRILLRRYVDELEGMHDAKIHAVPPEDLPEHERYVFFGQPIHLDSIFHGFFAAGRELANAPESLLTENHPALPIITGTGSEEEPQLVSSRLVEESMAMLNRAQLLAFGALVIFVAGLIVVALAAFRPLVAEIHRETTLLEEANAELSQLSMEDPLSGVANRRAFNNALEEEWRRMARDGREIACLMVDLDSFKAFNDLYGHPEGDECIVKIGDALKKITSRAGETAARLGGEEFAVILPEFSCEEACAMAEQVRKTVFDLAIPHENSQVDSVVTVSVGVAVARPTKGADPYSLPAEADRALYVAKRAGRNQVVCASKL
ncbi:MAG: GGDEF domain-containing protein, partial [Gemmatimonadota bacterium]|nr:GGDEF domain-containing protein [Gemmatimonadota bacterium]